jgi:hypothetical protein
VVSQLEGGFVDLAAAEPSTPTFSSVRSASSSELIDASASSLRAAIVKVPAVPNSTSVQPTHEAQSFGFPQHSAAAWTPHQVDSNGGFVELDHLPSLSRTKQRVVVDDSETSVDAEPSRPPNETPHTKEADTPRLVALPSGSWETTAAQASVLDNAAAGHYSEEGGVIELPAHAVSTEADWQYLSDESPGKMLVLTALRTTDADLGLYRVFEIAMASGESITLVDPSMAATHNDSRSSGTADGTDRTTGEENISVDYRVFVALPAITVGAAVLRVRRRRRRDTPFESQPNSVVERASGLLRQRPPNAASRDELFKSWGCDIR